MRYTTAAVKLTTGEILYSHLDNIAGITTIISTSDSNGELITPSEFENRKTTHGVQSTEYMEHDSIAHRYAHHFNKPQGIYECYTSTIQGDADNTVLYYVKESTMDSADNYVIFKTDNANPNGVEISLTELNNYLTNYQTSGILPIPFNKMLNDFKPLLQPIL